MLNSLVNLSLAKKLSFLTLVLCLAGTLAILAQVYRSSIQLNEEIINNELNVQKSFVSSTYIEPLWNFSEARVAEVSTSFLENEKGFFPIVYIKVTDYKGQLLFSKSNNQNRGLPTNKLELLPFTKKNTILIKKDGQLLGTVYTISSYEGVINKLKNNLLYIFFFAMLISVIVSFCIYLFFNNLLTKPFNSLLSHINQIENHNYDTFDFKTNSYEMLLISNSLNKTSQIIKKRNNDLKHHSENLELMVTERTKELESMTIRNVNSSRLAAVGEMASGMAHEINNPLAIINGQVYVLKNMIKLKNKHEDFETPLKTVSLMIERITKIIKGLKNISRDGSNDPMADFSIKNLVEEIKFLTEMKISSLSIKLEIDIDPSINMALGREIQISQVLVNLVHNAIDAIRNQEIKWVKIEIKKLGHLIEFKITDSGTGIPKEIIDKIMLPFFTTKEVGQGTGLGLSISRGIVLDHGGDFYYNDKSPNTQFVFTILAAQNKALSA